jgi:crossover junction endodeoxyribonuclease RuvC
MAQLGIDVGVANLGYCVFDICEKKFNYLTSGYLSTKQHKSTERRLKLIYDFFKNIIKTTNIKTLVYEQPFFNRGTNGANVIKAEGVLLLLAGEFNLPVFSYTASAVKKAVSKDGTADKQKVDDAVCDFLGLKLDFKTDHESDSCAVAITHYLKTDAK